MKILIVSAFQPSSETAGQVFTHGLVSALASTHEVRVIYFTRSRARSRAGDLATAESHGSNVGRPGVSGDFPDGTLSANAGGSLRMQALLQSPVFSLLNWIFLPWLHPLYTRRFSPKAFFAIATMLQDFRPGILYFDFSQTFVFSLFFRAPHVVLMAHDVQLQRYSRHLYPEQPTSKRPPGQGLAGFMARLELAWIRAGEGLLFRHPGGKHILTLCDKDARLVSGNYGLYATAVTPFIGAGAFRCAPSGVPAVPTFCLFASWARPDNVEGLSWYFERVHPGIVERGWQILVIGAGMDKALRARIEGQPGVQVLGFVDDPYPLLAKTTALLAPLFSGAGIKFKVLESLACGTPVIGTDIAFEGIDELLPGDFSVFSSATGCAAAMIRAAEISEGAQQRAQRAGLYRNRLRSGTPDQYFTSHIPGFGEVRP